MNIKQVLHQACAIALVITAGCSSPVTQTATATSADDSTRVPSTSTSASTSALSLTPVPTKPSLSLTPFPLLSAEQATIKLLDLLQDNGECQLPCFLGYLPGITTSEEMNQFFDQFVVSRSADTEISKSQDGNTQSVRFYFPQENLYFNAGMSSWENNNTKKVVILGMGTFLTGPTEYSWSSSYYEAVQYYMLPQILKEYGKPSQVLILTFRDDRQRPDVTAKEFFLVLLYSEQGIYIKYKMDRQIVGNNFLGCPLKSFVDVAVWNPEDQEAFKQVVEIMNNGGDLSPYKPIDDATSMSIDEFYRIFTDPNSRGCIETPIDLWANP